MMLMTSASVPLLPLALLVGWCKAAVPADEITKLPGWDGPLPTKHYSGCADCQLALEYFFSRFWQHGAEGGSLAVARQPEIFSSAALPGWM
jgi:hypothetical protein